VSGPSVGRDLVDRREAGITRIDEHDWRTGGLLLVPYGGFFLVLR
jgi:hypothetical protein